MLNTKSATTAGAKSTALTSTTAQPPALNNIIRDFDNLIKNKHLSPSQKIDHFCQLNFISSPDFRLDPERLTSLINLLQQTLSSQPPSSIPSPNFFLIFNFIQKSSWLQKFSTEPEEKEPSSSLTASWTQLVETLVATPAYWKMLFAGDPPAAGSPIPLFNANFTTATALLSYAPFTQTHLKDSRNNLATYYQNPDSRYHGLLGTHKKRADLVDLMFYLDQVLNQNKGFMRDDRKRVRAEAYLEILKTLERWTVSGDEVQCRAELTYIIQTKIQAEDKLANGIGWRQGLKTTADIILVIGGIPPVFHMYQTPATFPKMLERLFSNLDQVLPQYQKHRATFQAQLTAIQPKIAELFAGNLPAEKSEDDRRHLILTRFLSDKKSQISSEQKPFKDYVCRGIAAGVYSLEALFSQLHPEVLVELYQNEAARSRVPQTTWHQQAQEEGYRELATACLNHALQELKSAHPRPQTSEAMPAPEPTEVKVTPPPNPETVVNLALAISTSFAVKACLEAFTDPSDASIISPADRLAPLLAARCYEFLVEQYELTPQEKVTFRYQLALIKKDERICVRALDLREGHPLLANCIVTRLLSILPKGPNIPISEVQSALENDPGYKALRQQFTQQSERDPSFGLCFALYEIYKALSLDNQACSMAEILFQRFYYQPGNHQSDRSADRLDLIEFVLLFERTQLASDPTGMWKGPSRPSNPQADPKGLLLPADLPTDTLRSKGFQETTLATLTYLAKYLYPQYPQAVNVLSMAANRVQALLRPYTTPLTTPINNPEATRLCQRIMETPNIAELLDAQTHRFLLRMSSGDFWPDPSDGLEKLLAAKLLSYNPQVFTKEVLAVLNTKAVTQLLLQLNSGVPSHSIVKTSFEPADAIEAAEKCLGSYGADWTPIQKLYLGLWLKDCGYPLTNPNVTGGRDKQLFWVAAQADGTRRLIRPTSWKFSELQCRMFQQTLVECALVECAQPQTSIADTFELLTVMLGFFNHNVTPTAVLACRRVMGGSPVLLTEAHERLQNIDPAEGFQRPDHFAEAPYVDMRVAYRRALGLLESSQQDAKACKTNPISEFIRYESRAVTTTEGKRNHSPSVAEAKPLSVQLVQEVTNTPKYWDYLFTRNQKDLLVIDVAMELKSVEVIGALLQIAPHTQLQHDKKKGKICLDFLRTTKTEAANSLLALEKKADLVDFKVYIDQVLIKGKGLMQDDRKLVRGKAYLDIFELLESWAQTSKPATSKRDLIALIERHLAAEAKVSSKWYRIGSTSEFVGILEGLKLNAENLVAQYTHFRVAFQAHIAAIAPLVQTLQPKSAGVPQDKRRQIKFSLAEEDDGTDANIHGDLRHSNKGGTKPQFV